MRRRTQTASAGGKIIAYKLDPGVFVVDVPQTGRRISLGQPPDAVKRFQQVGYAAEEGIDTFLLVDSKTQGDSISWILIEFPVLYALYYIPVEVNGKPIPAFFAGKKPMLIGLENDVRKAMVTIKYGNYGVDSIDEFDALDVPPETRDAMRQEILGLAVGNEVKDSESFLDSVVLDPNPKDEGEFSEIGEGIRVGRIGRNTYRFVYDTDHLDVDVTLLPHESFRSPVEYKHLKFPVTDFGIWHTGEYDGMDPYYSAQHTTLIHRYEPILIDYPSNMTNIINHNGLSKHSINTLVVTHNHDDHIGAVVELFRRSERCHIITTAPVRHSMIKKLAALVDIPEATVADGFTWTLLPFRKDKPYQTEPLNLNGIHITGHLSCHAVPTTIYTFRVNHDGHDYSYGHFLDIVAFRRMEKMVREGWMPAAHLAHLDHLIRGTEYNLIKYDVGCLNDAALPFAVHGQWQDLKGAATERAFRVFTHATKDLLDPAYEEEGRFVAMGDLDSTVRDASGRWMRLGTEKAAVTAFYSRAYQAVLAYFESLFNSAQPPEMVKLMRHYAGAFANCSKQPDPNIGAFLFEQGGESNQVVVIVRGQAEIRQHGENGELLFRSSVGDGEVLGDVGVLANQPRLASVKSLNRLAYVAVPGTLFREAMGALGITYEGHFKELFERRQLF
ncbi:MAG: cyclic nucleotide-binding domain-containing protein, partial [SAR324 cluster bacterium]|nr:cyclic nucleotide-binding domain-containing protein [SAR324 cluster bacterium]